MLNNREEEQVEDVYSKHSVFTASYSINENGLVEPSENSEWITLKYDKDGTFSQRDSAYGKICMILVDNEKEFWPVMSFLSPEEAVELGMELINIGRGVQQQEEEIN